MSALGEFPIHVISAGDDSPDPFVGLAKALGILERCHFESPREDVLDFYAAADLYVSPSREDSFGLPAAEAMACGLPVITSTFAGVSELIQNGVDGFVLRDPRDSQELAQLLGELIRDPVRRESFGEAASRAAAAWTWDHHAEAVFDLLRTAAARK